MTHIPANKAMIAALHGAAHPLLIDADESIDQFIVDTGYDYCFDPLTLEDGMWVCSLSLVDDGPGDWPGSRECKLQITPLELVTPEEWSSYRNEEWPWEPGLPLSHEEDQDIINFAHSLDGKLI